MFEVQNAGNNGFAPWDVDGAVPKLNRGRYAFMIAEGMADENPGSFDPQVRRVGDAANALFWPHLEKNGTLPRGVVGSWSFAYAAKAVNLTAPAAPAFGVGSSPITGGGPKGTKLGGGAQNLKNIPVSWLPLQNKSKKVDEDFKPRSDVTMLSGNFGGKIPGGVEAMIVATTGHGERHPMALTPGGPLIAHHEGPTPPDFSRHVFDIDAMGNLDAERHQGLHSIWRVRGWVETFCSGIKKPDPKYAIQLPPAQNGGGYTIMLNATKSEGDNTGYLPMTFTGDDAVFSHEVSGPLRPTTGNHLLAVTKDGRKLVAGGIDTGAYYTNGQVKFDGPLEFIFQDYVPPSRGTHPYVVELRMDNNQPHGFFCGQRDNLWRWETWIPVTETPPCFGEVAYIKVDSNSNPDRTTEAVPAVYAHAPYEGKGMILQPRADILAGAPALHGEFERV